MKNKWKIVSMVIVCMLLVGGVYRMPLLAQGQKESTPPTSENDNTLTLVHTNDMHGRIEPQNGSYGLASVKTYLNDINPALVVDAGDAFQGLPISNLTQGKHMAQIMNALRYDAAAVGNHEFDFGEDVLLKRKPGFGQTVNFPLLSANTVAATGNLLVPDVFVAEKNVNGRTYKIPIIGVTTPETSTKTHPSNIKGIGWKEPIPAVTKILTDPTYKDADFFVIVAHLGIDGETKADWRGDVMAQALRDNPELSDKKIVLVDGHSHSELLKSENSGNVIHVSSGEHLNNIGVLKLNLNDFSKSQHKLVPVKSITADYAPDPEVKAIMDDAKANYDAVASGIVVDNNLVELAGEREYVRTRETNLGNMIADSLVSYGEIGFTNKTDFAIVNGGGIRTSIKKGPVTLGDLISVLPFGNVTTQIEVKGSDVLAMFEHALRSDVTTEKYENGQPMLSPNGGFLQVSSTIQVHYDANQEPGKRVLSVKVYDRETDKFKPLVLDRRYFVATNDFLASGGDGYTMLGGARDEGPSMDDVFTKYLGDKSRVNWSLYQEKLSTARIIPESKQSFLDRQQGNPAILRAAIAKGMGVDRTLYTKESLLPFDAVMADAQRLIGLMESSSPTLKDTANVNEEAVVTAKMVNAMAAKIEQAIANLVLRVDVVDKPDVNKTQVDKSEGNKTQVDKQTQGVTDGALPNTGMNNRLLIVGGSSVVIGLVCVSLMKLVRDRRKPH